MVFSFYCCKQLIHNTTGSSLKFGPAFNKTFLLEVFRLQEKIERIGASNGNGLEKICFAPMTYANQKTKLEQCTVQSLFGFFKNSMDNFLFTDNTGEFEVNYLNKLDKCLS